MSEVSWTGPGCGRFRGLPCKAGGLGASATRRRKNQYLGDRAVAGFLGLGLVILRPVYETSAVVHETSDIDNDCQCSLMMRLAVRSDRAATRG